MPYFTPPTVWRTLDPSDRLFCRMKLPVGVAVIKSESGAYTTVENPSDEQIAAAAAAYLGGHTYEISASEADALTAAGYEVTP